MSKRSAGGGNRSAFKPRVRETNFLLSVIMTTAKMLFVVILLLSVAGGGFDLR